MTDCALSGDWEPESPDTVTTTADVWSVVKQGKEPGSAFTSLKFPPVLVPRQAADPRTPHHPQPLFVQLNLFKLCGTRHYPLAR